MKSSANSVYLTSNLSITNDENYIIDCLVDHDEMPANFETSHVISFYVQTDLYLVLYFPQLNDRGFQMYIVEDFSQNIDDLVFLREMFMQLVNEGHNPAILKKAHYKVDTILHMAKTLRAVIHKDAPDYYED
jgi:HKD family nuclease